MHLSFPSLVGWAASCRVLRCLALALHGQRRASLGLPAGAAAHDRGEAGGPGSLLAVPAAAPAPGRSLSAGLYLYPVPLGPCAAAPGAAYSAVQEAVVARTSPGQAAAPAVPPVPSGLGLAMASLGLSEREQAGCRDLLEFLETEELIALTDTVTNRLVHPESRQGARSPGRDRPVAAFPAPGRGCWNQPY